MADSYTANLNLTLPEVGASRDTWGGKVNADMTAIDTVFNAAGNGTSVGLNVGTGKTLTVTGTVNATGTVNLDTAVVINESGADKDLRVEGDTDVNLLFTDASTDRVGIGTNSPNYKLQVNPGNLGNTAGNTVSGFSIQTNTGNADHFDVIWSRTASSSGWSNADLIIRRNVDGSAAQGAIAFGGENSVKFYTNGLERARISDTGNVGIGTSSPTSKFDCLGTLSVSEASASGGAGGQLNFNARNDASTILPVAYIKGALSNGSVSGYSGGIVFGTAINNTYGERVRIDSSGNVGIGTNSPSGRLHLTGSCSTRWELTDANWVNQFATNPASNVYVGYALDASQIVLKTNGSERVRIDASGNVGIGGNLAVGQGPSTAAKVDIINSDRRYMFRDGRIDCVTTNNSAWSTMLLQGANIDLKTQDGTTRFYVASANNRAVFSNGSASRGQSGYPLTTSNDTVSNAIRASGYIQWDTDIGAIGTTYFTSDERKKENIEPSTFNSSALIRTIDFIQFDWKPDSGNEGHVDVGVSAQQLQSLDERLVRELSDGSLMVYEPALISHMAKAIQEQQKLIEKLEARIAALEAK